MKELDWSEKPIEGISVCLKISSSSLNCLGSLANLAQDNLQPICSTKPLLLPCAVTVVPSGQHIYDEVIRYAAPYNPAGVINVVDSFSAIVTRISSQWELYNSIAACAAPYGQAGIFNACSQLPYVLTAVPSDAVVRYVTPFQAGVVNTYNLPSDGLTITPSRPIPHHGTRSELSSNNLEFIVAASSTQQALSELHLSFEHKSDSTQFWDYNTFLYDVSQELVDFAFTARNRRISANEFFTDHLTIVPEFRNLYELAEVAFLNVCREALTVHKEIKKFLWKLSAKITRTAAQVGETISIEICQEGEKQKLWPLLMAFKNN